MVSLETTRLVAFLREHGAYVHPELELFGPARDNDRGVVALADIKAGELLIRLPASAVIAVCDDDGIPEWMPKAAASLSPVLRTALFLMHEESLGEASKWSPYLLSLPKAYDTLEHWTADELAELTGTCLHDELSKLRDSTGDLVGPVRVLWEKSVAPLVKSSPDLWPDASLEAFLRACAAVRTRGFFDTAAGGGGPYMLPAIDMLNHTRENVATTLVVEREAPAQNRGGASNADEGARCAQRAGATDASSSSQPSSSSSSSSPVVFSMAAERDLAPGDPVLHVYDHLDNTQLMLTYGFVAAEGEGALPATARLPLASLVAACAACRGRLPWDASEAGAAKEAACATLLAPYDGVIGVSVGEPLPDALVTVALLLLMPAPDFEQLLAESQPDALPGADASSPSPSARVPMLDASALEGEPTFAAVVVEAIIAAVSAAEARFVSPQDSRAADGRRLNAARALRQAEMEALGAARQAALRLLVKVGLGGDDDDEDNDGSESEDESAEGEEEEEDDEEGEEGDEEEEEEVMPSRKKSKRS